MDGWSIRPVALSVVALGWWVTRCEWSEPHPDPEYRLLSTHRKEPGPYLMCTSQWDAKVLQAPALRINPGWAAVPRSPYQLASRSGVALIL